MTMSPDAFCPDCGHAPHGADTVRPPNFDVRCSTIVGSDGGPMPEPVYCEHVDWGEVVKAVYALNPPRIPAPLDRVIEDLRLEIAEAMAHHAPMHSPHEGHSVIREELDVELWEHVVHDTGTSPEARKEALQVAAMGVRYILDLIDDPHGPGSARDTRFG